MDRPAGEREGKWSKEGGLGRWLHLSRQCLHFFFFSSQNRVRTGHYKWCMRSLGCQCSLGSHPDLTRCSCRERQLGEAVTGRLCSVPPPLVRLGRREPGLSPTWESSYRAVPLVPPGTQPPLAEPWGQGAHSLVPAGISSPSWGRTKPHRHPGLLPPWRRRGLLVLETKIMMCLSGDVGRFVLSCLAELTRGYADLRAVSQSSVTCQLASFIKGFETGGEDCIGKSCPV